MKYLKLVILYSSRCRAVGTAMTSPLTQSNTFEFIEYVMTQYLKRTIAKQWAVYVCITRAINVYVLKELFRVDPPILELLPTLTCRQVKHLSDQFFRFTCTRRCVVYVRMAMCSHKNRITQTDYADIILPRLFIISSTVQAVRTDRQMYQPSAV